MRSLTSLVAAALCATSFDVHAESPAHPANALDELIVTARRREEPLQGVPLAITRLDGHELESHAIRQPSDLGRAVPSTIVFTESSGSVNDASGAMRGLSAGDIAIAYSQPVGLYQDDIYIPHAVGANAVPRPGIPRRRSPRGRRRGAGSLAWN